MQSPPSRAAWIEMGAAAWLRVLPRSPPSRAAWIEMATRILRQIHPQSRRLHGRRGLKSLCAGYAPSRLGRRLHGRRGLKFRLSALEARSRLSPPSRAAWIEICCCCGCTHKF